MRVFVILIGLALASCKKTVRTEFVFISESFQNRFVDDGTTQIHDENDEGFFKDHFNISKANREFFSAQQIDKEILFKKTGIAWNQIAHFDSVLNFKNLFSINTNRVAYVIEYRFVDSYKDLFLSLGSDDGIKVWVNGEEIYSRNVWRGIQIDDDFIDIKLNSGWNTIVYKVSQGDGGWGLYRTFKEKKYLESSISHKSFDIYNDILEAAILEENEILQIKIDPRSKLDTFNTVELKLNEVLQNFDKSEVLKKEVLGSELPFEIKLPASFTGYGIFSLKVTRKNRTVFKEDIPVFNRSYIDRQYSKYSETQNGSQSDEFYWAKKNAFLVLYDKGEKASTRMLAESLHDLLQYEHKKESISHPGFDILGYRSRTDNSVQTYTLFSPNDSPVRTGVLIMHGEYDKDSDYWYSYEGGSHSVTTGRIASSIKWNIHLVMTHGRGIQNYLGEAKEELPLISKQLSSLSGINASHILVWSKGTTSLLELLKNVDLKLESVGIISPFVPDKKIEMQQLISYIKIRYPELKWFIRHGLNDSDSPISRTRKFVELLKNNNYEINYEEIPYSTHWNYIYDQEHKYYEYVSQN